MQLFADPFEGFFLHFFTSSLSSSVVDPLRVPYRSQLVILFVVIVAIATRFRFECPSVPLQVESTRRTEDESSMCSGKTLFSQVVCLGDP